MRHRSPCRRRGEDVRIAICPRDRLQQFNCRTIELDVPGLPVLRFRDKECAPLPIYIRPLSLRYLVTTCAGQEQQHYRFCCNLVLIGSDGSKEASSL